MLAQAEHWQDRFMKLLSGKGLSQKLRTQLIFVWRSTNFAAAEPPRKIGYVSGNRLPFMKYRHTWKLSIKTCIKKNPLTVAKLTRLYKKNSIALHTTITSCKHFQIISTSTELLQQEPQTFMPCSKVSSVTCWWNFLVYIQGKLMVLIRQLSLPETKQKLLRATEQRNGRLLYS